MIGLVIARAGSTEDVAAVDDLQRRLFARPWGIDALRWELEHSTVTRLYVARTAGAPVIAYCLCWIVADELHINSLAVDPAYQRRGVGAYLLAHVLREAAGAGASGATLEVRSSNLAARALYERAGFRIEAVRRDYYQSPREDALVLWLRPIVSAGDVVGDLA